MDPTRQIHVLIWYILFLNMVNVYQVWNMFQIR